MMMVEKKGEEAYYKAKGGYYGTYYSDKSWILFSHEYPINQEQGEILEIHPHQFHFLLTVLLSILQEICFFAFVEF